MDRNGLREKDYRSYIGMLAKTKIPIVIVSWDDVAEVDKDLLWQDVLVCLLKATILFIILVTYNLFVVLNSKILRLLRTPSELGRRCYLT